MKRAEKERIAEQEGFERIYILEAFADIRASLDPDTATLEAHAKAYIAMLRLKERWNCTVVDSIYYWLTGRFDQIDGRDLRKRLGRNIRNFLKQQPVPYPTRSLEDYREQHNLYIHPELCAEVDREGRFYIEEGSYLVTRLTHDCTLRTYPIEGPWKLHDSYVEALKTKKSHINKIMVELGEMLEKTEEEIRKEEVRDAK